ncbi:MAG: mRNA surveillance protein pelota [Candidatus Woesearchaeota archaeon]
MKKLSYNAKTGVLVVIPQSVDDLWLLSSVIQPRAFVTAKTTRKVRLSDTKVEKKVYIMRILVEAVLFENELLRVQGLVQSEHDDIAKGSNHSFSIGIHDQITVEQDWLAYHLSRIQEAGQEKVDVLLVAMDREEAFFAHLTGQGYEIISHLKGDVVKKGDAQSVSKDFYAEIITVLKEYISRYSLNHVVIASPSFFKEDLVKRMPAEMKKKVVLATCSDVSERAFAELLKRDEVKSVLASERLAYESSQIEEFFTALGKDGLCTYGPHEVSEHAKAGAILKLFVSTNHIAHAREKNSYDDLHILMKTVEDSRGEVIILSSENEAGARLDGVSGIAALIRFRLA